MCQWSPRTELLLGSRCGSAVELLSSQIISLDQAELLIGSRAAVLAPVGIQLFVAEMRSPLSISTWCNLAATVQGEKRTWLFTTIVLK